MTSYCKFQEAVASALCADARPDAIVRLDARPWFS